MVGLLSRSSRSICYAQAGLPKVCLRVMIRPNPTDLKTRTIRGPDGREWARSFEMSADT